MKPRVVLLHTVPALAPWLDALCREEVPEVEPVHMVDQVLLERAKAEGVTETMIEDFRHYCLIGREIGARAVLVTCSSIGPCVDAVRDDVEIPVFRIDAPMARTAARIGGRCVLLATVASTLSASTELLLAAAGECGRSLDVDARIVDISGEDESQRRDRLVQEVLRAAQSADVVVLAQASMARLLGDRPVPATCPVLTSPRSGLRQLADR